MNNMFLPLFGESPETQQARENYQNIFQSILNTRRQQAEQQRTDDVKMARYNALGNLLTTMVQPVGWAAGGGGTGGVQKYDDRQYISAFNRALKDADDIRNIGKMEEEFKVKQAGDEYARALKRDEQQQALEQKRKEYEWQNEQRLANAREEAKIRQEIIDHEYDRREGLAKTQTAGRVEVENTKASLRSSSSKGSKDSGKKKGIQAEVNTDTKTGGGKIKFSFGGLKGSKGKKDERLER